MSTRSRQEYLAVLRERYHQPASKKERSRLIDEVIKNTGPHRKSAIRALNSKPVTTVAGSDGPPISKLGGEERNTRQSA